MSVVKRPPRDGLFRARDEAPEWRDDDGDTPVLRGHFARFHEWTTIDSVFEGRFRERILPGAFSKTFKENRENIRCLFQHGRDPQVGDKPLGVFRSLEEDDEGAYYEVPLFDTSYNRDLEPGLRAGAYGASFAFSVVSEDFDREPGESEDNPEGLPERSIREVRCYEGGPVTFGAYEGATAGVRSVSLTDQVMIARAAQGNPERLHELADFFKREESAETVSVSVPDGIPSDETTPAEEISPEETEEVSDAPAETEAGPEVTSDDGGRAATDKTEGRPRWSFKNYGKEWRLP